jgi:hypothetical protein
MQDIYGRSWRYRPHPSHDLGQALQISLRLAEFGIETEWERCRRRTYQLRATCEPYLLKQDGTWNLYVRHGDAGSDYDNLAGDIDPRIISMMLEMHAKEIATPAEARAYDALVGEGV